MARKDTGGLDDFLKGMGVDVVGVADLGEYKDDRLWDEAQKLLPGAKSIVVMAMEVFRETVSRVTSRALIGDMALRDLYKANTDVIDGLLDWEGFKLVKGLHAKGYKGLLLSAGGAPYDARFLEGPLSYKHLAKAAGMGILGWSSLLLTPEYGGRVRLAAVITDAAFNASPPLYMENPCIECGGACIRICPAKAISKPEDGDDYRIDKYACSSYYTASGGCAECLKVCPAGRVSG
ncbi:MAG TPA: epoxyqueuosine reductase [Dehalococcoidia bacterium]|nr:epoxyqueuosine reductase [Dehalococcoidia bacterium]